MRGVRSVFVRKASGDQGQQRVDRVRPAHTVSGGFLPTDRGRIPRKVDSVFVTGCCCSFFLFETEYSGTSCQTYLPGVPYPRSSGGR